MSGKILVTLAVEAELTPWRRIRRFRRVRFGSSYVHQARIGNVETLVLLVGVGARQVEVVTGSSMVLVVVNGGAVAELFTSSSYCPRFPVAFERFLFPSYYTLVLAPVVLLE